MPNNDGTGPDGKGPKKENKGFPKRDGSGQGQRKGRGFPKRDGSGQGRGQGKRKD